MKNILFILILFFSYSSIFCQEAGEKKMVRFTIIDGDTMPMVTLRTHKVYEERVYKNNYEKRRSEALKRKVMKVYPYAKLAGQRLREYENQLVEIDSERMRKKFIKQVEKDLEAEFGDELRDLTISEGTILISLIDRETGDTSYELVKELRGSFSAFFWQSLARLFGHNLKDNYDSEGDEKAIEDIVVLIEEGVYKYDK